MARDNCKSRGEFIENAIRSYAGYLSGEDAVQFLPAARLSNYVGYISTRDGVERIVGAPSKPSGAGSMGRGAAAE